MTDTDAAMIVQVGPDDGMGDGPDAIRIGWDGRQWGPLDDPGADPEKAKAALTVAAHANDVAARPPGRLDHNFAPGAGMAMRVAHAVGGRAIKCPVLPPLEDGCVS